MSLNLLTDTSALLNVVIDPRSGDALNVRGQSNLVFQLEKSGKMDLTGSYEVNGGYYSLSFEVLKRKFSIDPGQCHHLDRRPHDGHRQPYGLLYRS